MKNLLKIMTLLGVAAIVATSCKEDEISLYDGPEAINLSYGETENHGSYTTTADVSFLALPPTETSYDFTVYATIMGVSSGSDRTFKLKAVTPGEDVEEEIAEPGVDFTFPAEVTIPAGESKVEFTLTVHKANTEKVEKTFLAMIGIEPTSDFSGGVSSTVSATFSTIFPTKWYASSGDMGYTGYLMGRCTPDKYKFVYEVYGTIDLTYWARGWMDYSGSAFVNQLNAALDEFERNNGYRLIDTYNGENVEMKFSAST